ncbi:flippase [Blautia sp.]|uniref:flippase n=1 Tax=Blautia sp. TaxID=1955243 RepID=UPI003AB80DB3
MRNKEKSIGVNAFLNGLKTILSVIFPLITYPYAARVLQVENMGKVDFSNSVVSYFVLIAGLGISTYAIREGAKVRDNRDDLDKFSSEMFSINIISVLISILALIIVIVLVPKFHSYIPLIFVQSFAIFGNLIGVTWLYSIVEDYVYITVRSLVVHVVALVLLFLFVHGESDYVFYAATTVIANVGANIFNFIHAKKYVRIRLITKLNLKKHIKPILIIFASAVTTTIYVNSDKTILGFLSDEFHVGLYSTSVNVYTVLKSCIAAVILVALPRLSNYLATGHKKEYEKTAIDIFKMFMMILLPVMVGLFVTADAVIEIIAGSSYAEAATSLRILSISLVFSMIATYYTNAVLLPMNQEAIVLKGTALSAILNIVLNFILIGVFKQNGAAFTTLLAELLMCIYQYFYVRKVLRIKISLRYITSLLVGCLGIVAVSIVCDIVFRSFIINLIMKITISILVYASALLGLKNDMAYSMFNDVIQKIKK